MNKAIYAIICIILIVSTPVTSFGYYNDPIEGDTRDLGEALTINVDHVSPTPITSDLFQHRAANVHVFLSGKTLGTALFGDSQSPAGAPFYGDMKIKHIDLIPNRESSKYIQGGLTSLVRPKGEELVVDANGNIDLGYTTVRLKRQPLEEKVPEEITIEVDARIYFDVESGFGVLSTQSFNLAPQKDEEAWLNKELKDSALWGGRGYIRVIEINGNTARVQLYDGNKRKIGFANQVKLTAGGEPKEVTLPGAPSLLESRINLKLERVSKNENKARLLIEEDLGEEIVSSTKDYVAGMKLNSEWVVKEIFSDGLIIVDTDGNELFIAYEEGSEISDPCANFRYLPSEQLSAASSTQLYCQAIEDYRSALQLAETSTEEAEYYVKISEAYEGLNSIEKANLFLLNAIQADPSLQEKYQERLDNSQLRLQNKYNYVKADDMLITLISIDDDAEQSKVNYAVLNSFDDSIINFDFDEGTIGEYISPEIIDESGNKYRWAITSISSNEVVIQQEFTELNSRNRPEANTRTLEIGKKTQVPFGTQSRFIYIDKIDVVESAIITVTPGTRDNYGTSQFTIHLPIEKRLWQWTPEEIDKMIASTDRTLSRLDGIINRLGSIISTWKGVCYATFAALTIKNAFFSNPAKRLIENRVREDCESVHGTNTQASINCFNDAKNEIEERVEISQRTKNELDELFKDVDFEDEESLQGIATRLNMDVTNLTLLHKYGDLSGQELYESMYDEEVWQDGSLDFDEQLQKVNKIDRSIREEIGDQELSDKEIKEIELRYRLSVGTGSLTTPSNAFFTDQDTRAQQTLQGRDIISRPNNNPFPLYTDGDNKYIIDTEGNKITVTPIMDGSEILSSTRGDFYEANGNIYLAGLSEGSFLTQYTTVPRIYFDDETNTPTLIPFQYNGGEESLSFANYIQVDENAERRGGYRFSVWNIGSDGIPDTEDDKLVMSSTQLHPDTRLKENDRLAYEIERTYQQAVPLATKDKGSIVKFNGQDILIEQYEGNIGSRLDPNGQCEDSMSSTDCKILYNVCDPVMCPPSRFNLGGRWDLGGDAGSVVQKGIIGSITLGWGNGDILPICLTGIHAGLENIYSMFGSFRDCLEVAKTSGESVGICNEIRSLYMCNILWEEALALVNVFGKIQSFISTAVFGSSGGGEYKLWESSWSRLGDSVNFFTKSYASSAFSAFRGRTSSEVGSTLCKQAIFGRTPAGGDLLGQLTSPESPPQFTGWFEEDRSSEVNLQSGFINTQATIGTGQSTYRIYYHIYAGRNKDIRYKVVLKDINGQTITVNDPGLFQGDRILRRGESVDQSFTLPNLPPGFVEMCIIIDGIQECGFGSTSSGFSTQYLKDELIKSTLNDNIQTAEQCVPRERSYVPGLFTSGVKRVCAAYDPDGVGDEWEFVGTCGQDDLGRELGNCYLYSAGIKQSLHDTSYNLSEVIAEAQRNNEYTPAQEQERRNEIQQTLDDNSEEEYQSLAFESLGIDPRDRQTKIEFIGKLYDLIDRARDFEVIEKSHSLAAEHLITLAGYKKIEETQQEAQRKLDEQSAQCSIFYDADDSNSNSDRASFRYLFGTWEYKLEGPTNNEEWIKIYQNEDCNLIKNSKYATILSDVCEGLVGKDFSGGVKEIVETVNNPPGKDDDHITVHKGDNRKSKFESGGANILDILEFCGQEDSRATSEIRDQLAYSELTDKEIEIKVEPTSSNTQFRVNDGELSLKRPNQEWEDYEEVVFSPDFEEISLSPASYGIAQVIRENMNNWNKVIIEHKTGDKNKYDTFNGQNVVNGISPSRLAEWLYYAIYERVENGMQPFELDIKRAGNDLLIFDNDKTIHWNGFYVEKKGGISKKYYWWEGFETVLRAYVDSNTNINELEMKCENGIKFEKTTELNDFNKIISWIQTQATKCDSRGTTTVTGTGDVYGAIQYAKENVIGDRRCDCGNNCQLYAQYIDQYSEEKDIDPLLVLAIMMHESGCDQSATSNTGARGLMQITGTGFDDACSDGRVSGASSVDGLKTNTKANVQCGVYVLSNAYRYWGERENGMSFQKTCDGPTTTYNGWEAAVRGYAGYTCGHHPNYVEGVMEKYNVLKSKFGFASRNIITTQLESKNDIVDVAKAEYSAWGEGARKECDMQNKLQSYFSTTSTTNWDCEDTPWSGAFISYVMKNAGVSDFPVSGKHSVYFTELRDNPNEYSCKTNDISNINNIKPGDILCRVESGSTTYNTLTPDRSGHCDVVTGVSVDANNNVEEIERIGGNRWNTNCHPTNTNYGCTVAKTTDNIDKLNDRYYGFISCGTSTTNFKNTKQITNVLAIGDSITANGGYANHLKANLESYNINLDYRGYSSCGIDNIRLRLLGSEQTRDCAGGTVDSFNLNNYDTVLVFAGINDIPCEGNYETYANKLETIYSYLKAQGKTVIALTLTPAGRWYEERKNCEDVSDSVKIIKDINNWILTNNNVDFAVDVFTPLDDGNGYLKSEYDGDGLHPNSQAHAVIGGTTFMEVFR